MRRQRQPRDATKRRPTGAWLLTGALGLVAIGGLATGPMLIADPTGGVIGARVDWLEGTPLSDWTLVGWFLLAVMGVVPSVILAGVVTRFRWPLAERIDPSRAEHWSWSAAQAMGVGLLVWIGLQVALIDLHGGPQPLFAVIGIVLVGVPQLPSVRRYLAV